MGVGLFLETEVPEQQVFRPLLSARGLGKHGIGPMHKNPMVIVGLHVANGIRINDMGMGMAHCRPMSCL